MPRMVDTPEWLVRNLRRRDWVSRHVDLEGLRGSHPGLYQQVMGMLGPDEALEGQATGILAGNDPIVLGDRPDRMARRVRRRPPRA